MKLHRQRRFVLKELLNLVSFSGDNPKFTCKNSSCGRVVRGCKLAIYGESSNGKSLIRSTRIPTGDSIKAHASMKSAPAVALFQKKWQACSRMCLSNEDTVKAIFALIVQTQRSRWLSILSCVYRIALRLVLFRSSAPLRTINGFQIDLSF